MALYGVVALALTVVAAATPGVGPTDAARPLPEPHGVEGSVAMIEFYCLASVFRLISGFRRAMSPSPSRLQHDG